MRVAPIVVAFAFFFAATAARADDPPKEAPKLAPDFEVSSDTTAQFYEVRSPSGFTLLQRRRLTTTLGVSAYELYPRPKGAGGSLYPELTFRARMRYDADYGADAQEADTSVAARFVPGFSRGPIDLMYGYVEGRRFLKGILGFKIGRQYVTDSLGWWSFDGGLVRVTTPFYVAVEGYGGLEVRGGFPLSPSVDRWSRGGVFRGDRSNIDPNFWPQFQPVDVAPAFGVAVETQGVTWLHSRLAYRRVYNTGASNASEFASGLTTPVGYKGTRISQERLGYSLSATHHKFGGVQGGLTYDFYSNRIPSVYASAEAYVGQKLTVGLDYDFYQPAFDGDSIWNFFASQPTHYMGLRGDVQINDQWSVAAAGFGRAFTQATSPQYDKMGTGVGGIVPSTTPACATNFFGSECYPTNGVVFMGGGSGQVRYKTSNTMLGLRTNMQFGDGGRRAGGDVFGERVWLGRYVANARVGTWEWKDDLRPDREATNFQYVVGLGYRFFNRSQATVEWEHNVNRLVGQRFRLMFWLTLAVLR